MKIGWKSKKEKFAGEHADKLQRFNRAFRLLKKYEAALPLDVKPLRAEQAALKKSSADLTAQLEAVQSSLDELKQVRWCVRQVLPDAPPRSRCWNKSKPVSGKHSRRGSRARPSRENRIWSIDGRLIFEKESQALFSFPGIPSFQYAWSTYRRKGGVQQRMGGMPSYKKGSEHPK